MFKWAMDNQFIFLLGVIIISGTIIIIIRWILNYLKNHSLKVTNKLGTIETTIDNGQVIIKKDNERDNTPYLLHMNEAIDCVYAIQKLKLRLVERQSEVFATNFKQINTIIIEQFRTGYMLWAKEKSKPIPKDFDNSQEFLKYQLIIKEITEENLSNVHHYVMDNDLWRYSEKDWILYKKRNYNKYNENAKSKFKLMYNATICKVPTMYHHTKIMPDGVEKIKDTIGRMQDELRENSLRTHKDIMKIEKALHEHQQFKSPTL